MAKEITKNKNIESKIGWVVSLNPFGSRKRDSGWLSNPAGY